VKREKGDTILTDHGNIASQVASSLAAQANSRLKYNCMGSTSTVVYYDEYDVLHVQAQQEYKPLRFTQGRL